MTKNPRLSRAVELVHGEERRLPDVLHGELELPLLLRGGEVEAWGDNPVSSCRSYSRAKDPGTRAGAFPVAFPYLERVQGVLNGMPRGPAGPA